MTTWRIEAFLIGLLIGVVLVLSYKVWQYSHVPAPKPTIIYRSPVPMEPTPPETVLT